MVRGRLRKRISLCWLIRLGCSRVDRIVARSVCARRFELHVVPFSRSSPVPLCPAWTRSPRWSPAGREGLAACRCSLKRTRRSATGLLSFASSVGCSSASLSVVAPRRRSRRASWTSRAGCRGWACVEVRGRRPARSPSASTRSASGCGQPAAACVRAISGLVRALCPGVWRLSPQEFAASRTVELPFRPASFRARCTCTCLHSPALPIETTSRRVGPGRSSPLCGIVRANCRRPRARCRRRTHTMEIGDD